MLRDRLIRGVNDPRMQRRLLSEADLDYNKALKIARAMEMADKDAQKLKGEQSDKAAPETEGVVHKAGSYDNNRKRELRKLLQVWWKTQDVSVQTQRDCMS